MKLVAIMPVRNEDWILGLSLRVALMWCDAVVVGLHACTDRSLDIAREVQDENPDRVVIVVQSGRDWPEMDHRQDLLVTARTIGATHIAIVDADEILTGNLLQRNGFGQGAYFTRDGLQPGQILGLPGYNLRGGIDRYHADGIWGRRWFSLVFCDDPCLSWSGDRFHSRMPQGKRFETYKPVNQGEGGVLHLWGASERRLRAKHALYKVTERLRWPNKPMAEIERMYSWAIHGDQYDPDPAYGTPKTWTYATTPAAWWAPYAHQMHHLHVDAEPWQEAECSRLVAEHGQDKFSGLDLFGVA